MLLREEVTLRACICDGLAVLIEMEKATPGRPITALELGQLQALNDLDLEEPQCADLESDSAAAHDFRLGFKRARQLMAIANHPRPEPLSKKSACRNTAGPFYQGIHDYSDRAFTVSDRFKASAEEAEWYRAGWHAMKRANEFPWMHAPFYDKPGSQYPSPPPDSLLHGVRNLRDAFGLLSLALADPEELETTAEALESAKADAALALEDYDANREKLRRSLIEPPARPPESWTVEELLELVSNNPPSPEDAHPRP